MKMFVVASVYIFLSCLRFPYSQHCEVSKKVQRVSTYTYQALGFFGHVSFGLCNNLICAATYVYEIKSLVQ